MFNNKQTSYQEAGFTLLEILVVVVIIGVLATFVAPNIFNRVGESYQVATQNQMAIFKTALELYRLDNGRYPTTDQGLQALISKPSLPPVPGNWSQPYLDEDVPKDPWGNSYIYKCPGEKKPAKYDLISYGRDGVPGGEGEDADISNWNQN